MVQALSEVVQKAAALELQALQRALLRLETLDHRLGAAGAFFKQGCDAATRALAAVESEADAVDLSLLVEIGERGASRPLQQPGGTDSQPTTFDKAATACSLPAPPRLLPGGRTYETGLQHLAALQELEPYRLLLIGDSHAERFAKRVHGGEHLKTLEQELRVRAFAAGVGGDAAVEVAWRLRQQRLLDHFPVPLVAVVVFAGSNDLLRGGDPEGAAAAVVDLVLRQIGNHPVAQRAALMVHAAPPMRSQGLAGSERVAAFAAARRCFLRHLAALLVESHGSAELVDFLPSGEGDDAMPEGLFVRDGVHLSSEGYNLVATGLASHLRKRCASLAPQRLLRVTFA